MPKDTFHMGKSMTLRTLFFQFFKSAKIIRYENASVAKNAKINSREKKLVY